MYFSDNNGLTGVHKKPTNNYPKREYTPPNTPRPREKTYVSKQPSMVKTGSPVPEKTQGAPRSGKGQPILVIPVNKVTQNKNLFIIIPN